MDRWHAWSNSSVWFHMDFIGLLFLLGWSIRGRSGFCPLRLFRGLFLFLGCEIGIVLVSQTLVRGFGGLYVGLWYWIWST